MSVTLCPEKESNVKDYLTTDLPILPTIGSIVPCLCKIAKYPLSSCLHHIILFTHFFRWKWWLFGKFQPFLVWPERHPATLPVSFLVQKMHRDWSWSHPIPGSNPGRQRQDSELCWRHARRSACFVCRSACLRRICFWKKEWSCSGRTMNKPWTSLADTL